MGAAPSALDNHIWDMLTGLNVAMANGLREAREQFRQSDAPDKFKVSFAALANEMAQTRCYFHIPEQEAPRG